MEEVWKKHPYLNGVECSSWGRVKTNGNLRKLTVDSKKKYYILKIDKQNRMVHRLVYEAFNGIIEDNMEIDHINTNGFDNRPENLRALSHSDNCRNPESIANYRLGKGYGSKLEAIIDGEHILASSYRDMEAKIGISHGSMASYVGKTWYSKKLKKTITLREL